jgi:peroxiredoxin
MMMRLSMLLAMLMLGFTPQNDLGQRQAANFQLPSISGERVSLEEFRGQVVLLNFWATWSSASRQALPGLYQLHKKYYKYGFRVVTVNIDKDLEPVIEFIKKQDMRLLTLWDPDQDVLAAYDFREVPSSVIIDRDGNIRYMHEGLAGYRFSRLATEVRSLLDGASQRSNRRRDPAGKNPKYLCEANGSGAAKVAPVFAKHLIAMQ